MFVVNMLTTSSLCVEAAAQCFHSETIKCSDAIFICYAIIYSSHGLLSSTVGHLCSPTGDLHKSGVTNKKCSLS